MIAACEKGKLLKDAARGAFFCTSVPCPCERHADSSASYSIFPSLSLCTVYYL